MTDLSRESLATLLDAVEIMDQKITPYGEREDGTIQNYIVADSTWHRVLAAARALSSRAEPETDKQRADRKWRLAHPEAAVQEPELLERLAAIEHEQWIEWSRTIAQEGLTPERIARWAGFWRPYEELDEPTKNYDRKWARKVLVAIGHAAQPAPDLDVERHFARIVTGRHVR